MQNRDNMSQQPVQTTNINFLVVNVGDKSVEQTNQIIRTCLQSIQYPSSLLPSLVSQSPQTSPTSTPHSSPQRRSPQSKESTFRNGTFGIVMAKVLDDFDAYDEEHAISETKIIENGIKLTNCKLSKNPGSSCKKFSPNAIRAIKKLIDSNLIGKSEKGYYLTPEGRKKYEEKILADDNDVRDSNENDTNSPSNDNEDDDNGEQLNDNNDNNDNEGEEVEGEEEKETYKDKLFIFALYLLKQDNPYSTSKFTKKEVLDMTEKVKESFTGVDFDEDESILIQNINDDYVINIDDEFELSGKGLDLVDTIAIRLTEIISQGPPKKRSKLF